MINREAWLSAIQDVAEPITDDPDALTAREFAALYHCGVTTASHRLRALEADGRVEVVTKLVKDVSNRTLRVRAFRLVKPSNKRK